MQGHLWQYAIEIPHLKAGFPVSTSTQERRESVQVEGLHMLELILQQHKGPIVGELDF